MLRTFKFAPAILGRSHNDLGLSPLQFTEKSRASVHYTNQQLTRNNEATVVTTEDVKQTKLGAPVLPTNKDALSTILELLVSTVTSLLGNKC